MSDLDIESEQKLQEVVAEMRIKAVDLGGKVTGEFLAQGIDRRTCGATGNCEFWVLKQKGDNYSVILHHIATQTFTIQPTLTKGFHDIVLAQHGSAFLQKLHVYRFDGFKYRSVACYDATWRVPEKDSEDQGRKEPQTTPCKNK